MTIDLDIWRSAHHLIQQHGDDAVIQAAMRADALHEAGDMDGRRASLRIVEAIRDFQSREAPDDVVGH